MPAAFGGLLSYQAKPCSALCWPQAAKNAGIKHIYFVLPAVAEAAQMIAGSWRFSNRLPPKLFAPGTHSPEKRLQI
jgi:hypothetical protein